MQPERAVVLIRQSRMRSVGVQHLEQPIDVILPVGSPLVPALRQKTALGEERAAVLGRRLLRSFLGFYLHCDVIEQSFQEAACLAVRRRPIAPRMRFDCLIKVPHGHDKVEMLQELVDFIVGRR